ncbi:hypothetical protein, variant [Phialophora macrospora]|uniref:Peptidase S8/S53 domain-containing protein n=1 Tax=Phialophora macrospora TaxID=1851006 RepID=A0A0D2DY45_9EURO|nr:hypothetical protein, variant [Phialophora macrospora]
MSDSDQSDYHSEAGSLAGDAKNKTDQIKILLGDIRQAPSCKPEAPNAPYDKEKVKDLEDRINACDLVPSGGQTDEGRDNILHRLANFVDSNDINKTADIEKFELLVEIVLGRNWSLMEAGDADGKTALCIAIKGHRIRLIELFDRVAKKLGKSLTKAIANPQHSSKRTSLHEIITRQLWRVSQKHVIHLLEECDEETLIAKDSEGQTALHLAVKYENFCQLKSPQAASKITEMLVQKCPRLLDCRNSKGAGELTPLQLLHEEQRDLKSRCEAAKKSRIDLKDKSEPGVPHIPEEQSSHKLKRRESNMDGGEPVKDRFIKPASQNTARKISAAQNTATAIKTTALIQDPTVEKAINYEQALIAFTEIDDHLTWMVFRHYRYGDAREIIQGRKPTKALDFNLLGVKTRLDVKEIKEYYKFLDFGKTLQFVALPMLRQVGPPPVTVGTKRAGKRDRDEAEENWKLTSPNQYVDIFNWLKSSRGVKRVLEIIIEDDWDNPHSDSDIQNAIANLGVEIWNWRKYDISSDTVVQAAPQARAVYLYTTGKKAVLREWSGEDGLRRLKDLQRVVLYVSGVELGPNKIGLRKDVQENLGIFKSRLLALINRDRRTPLVSRKSLVDLLQDGGEYKDAKEIKTEHFIEKVRGLQAAKLAPLSKQKPETQSEQQQQQQQQSEKSKDTITLDWYPILSSENSSDGYFPTFGKADQQRAHRWIQTVKNCARWVANSVGETNDKDRIKVALIDDGVDASHDSLHSFIKMGLTYCTAHSGDRQISSSFYASTTGHGTFMATLIRLVCPYVDLYVAKLDDHKRSVNSGFTAESAIMVRYGKISLFFSLSFSLPFLLSSPLLSPASRRFFFFFFFRTQHLVGKWK